MDGLDSSNQMGGTGQDPMSQPQQPIQEPPMQQQPPVQPPTQEPSQMQPAEMPQAPKSSKGLIISLLVGIILIAAGIGGYYYYAKNLNKKTETPPATSTYQQPSTSTSGTTIQATYTKTVALQPTSAKSQAVNNIFFPILQKVFNNQIKLSDDMGSMMTYIANRPITATDVTTVKTNLESLGYTAADTSSKQLTMMKTPYTWVITFSVASETKATIQITY